MENKKILREYRELNTDKTLIEQLNDPNYNGPIVLKGIFQEAGIRNQNGRIYPFPVLKREIDKFQELIEEGRAFGALDHPESSIVELNNACHLIKKMYFDGNKVLIETQVLDTDSGKNLKAILKAGGKVGISSRSYGSTTAIDEETEQVNDDLSLLTGDIVSQPSVKSAILSESLIYKHKKLVNENPKLNKINEILDYIKKEY
jgi:hypothetical protein